MNLWLGLECDAVWVVLMGGMGGNKGFGGGGGIACGAWHLACRMRWGLSWWEGDVWAALEMLINCLPNQPHVML